MLLRLQSTGVSFVYKEAVMQLQRSCEIFNFDFLEEAIRVCSDLMLQWEFIYFNGSGVADKHVHTWKNNSTPVTWKLIFYFFWTQSILNKTGNR